MLSFSKILQWFDSSLCNLTQCQDSPWVLIQLPRAFRLLYRNKTKQNKKASSPVYVFPLGLQIKRNNLAFENWTYIWPFEIHHLGNPSHKQWTTIIAQCLPDSTDSTVRPQHLLKPKVSMMGSTFKGQTPLILQSNAGILTQKAIVPRGLIQGQDLLQDKQYPHSWALLQGCSGIHLHEFPGPTGVFQFHSK